VHILWLLLLVMSEGSVLAQSVPPSEPAQPKGTSPKAAAPQPPSMPSAEKIVVLLRATLLTLNDALRTGNFTVLRDVGAPGFREANSAARLSSIFANLTQQGVDLSAVAIIAPQLTEAPAILPATGMLRLKGHFPGQPVRIDFEVLYQPQQGRWQLFGLSVQPTRVPANTAAATAQKPEQAASKAEPSKK